MVRRAACARIKAVWSCRNDPVDIAGWGHFSAHRQRYRQAAGIQVSNAAMNLDENQKQQVAKWLNDGLKLADVQKKLEQDFALKLTYMEVKFLVSDLNMRPKDPEPEKVVAPPPAAAAGQGTAAEPGLGPDYDDGALEEALPAEPGLPSGGGVLFVQKHRPQQEVLVIPQRHLRILRRALRRVERQCPFGPAFRRPGEQRFADNAARPLRQRLLPSFDPGQSGRVGGRDNSAEGINRLVLELLDGRDPLELPVPARRQEDLVQAVYKHLHMGVCADCQGRAVNLLGERDGGLIHPNQHLLIGLE